MTLLSLLQNPSIMTAENLLLDINNPLKQYESPNNVLGEAMSGSVYREAYKRLITDPNTQLFVPSIWNCMARLNLGVLKEKDSEDTECYCRLLSLSITIYNVPDFETIFFILHCSLVVLVIGLHTMNNFLRSNNRSSKHLWRSFGFILVWLRYDGEAK